MMLIIIKILFKEEAQLDLHPVFPGVLIEVIYMKSVYIPQESMMKEILFFGAFIYSISMEDLGLFPPKTSSVFFGNLSAGRSLKTFSIRF